jgi:purine-binding chemotaxis protein CheW
MNSDRQFCTFKVEDLFFGVEVARVQEVVREQHLTRVPLAPREVRGLINLRGQLVTAIDLRRRLGLADASADQRSMNVLLQGADGAVSLVVDAIEDVLELDHNLIERAPETVQSHARDLIRGAVQLKDRLLLILDADRALALPAAVA